MAWHFWPRAAWPDWGGRWLFPEPALQRWIALRTDWGAGAGGSEPPPIIAGSDDPLLGWALRESRCGLALLAEGSLAGLDALADGRAMFAAIHLPDPDGGDWNVPLIQARLPAAGLVALTWASRAQGLIVASGNPLGVRELSDLSRTRFALRHPRSGSHALLTHLLSESGMLLSSLAVSVADVADHEAVARAVATGAADAGFGIQAAADSAGLSFVPLTNERFDLVLRRDHAFRPDVQALLSFARTPGFATRASALGGYDLSAHGQVVLNQ